MLWAQVVFFEELKRSFSSEHCKQLFVQVSNGVAELCTKQPGRRQTYALTGCASLMELFRLNGNDIERTGPLDFLSLKQASPTMGFSLYVSLLASTIEALGYKIVNTQPPTTLLSTFSGMDFVLSRDGLGRKPNIFHGTGFLHLFDSLCQWARVGQSSHVSFLCTLYCVGCVVKIKKETPTSTGPHRTSCFCVKN